MQKAFRVRSSKFGPAFVIETTPQSGQYILGFRIDPVERIQTLFKEVTNLHTVFSQNPVFGVEFELEEKPASLDQLKVHRAREDVEIVHDEEVDPFAAYYAEGGNQSMDRDPEYNDELGLAVEQLRDGMTISKLWQCIHK